MSQNETKKVKFGLRIKMIIVILVAVLVTAISCSLSAIPKADGLLTDAISNNILNLSLSYGRLLDSSLNDHNGTLTVDEYADLLKNISIGGYETGYAYLVSNNGTMMYHPTESKIGSPVENVVVTGLVAGIANNEFPAPEVISYDFKGAMKMAGYYISPIDHSILVITIDQDDVSESLNSFNNSIFLYSLLAFAVLSVAGMLIASSITKPFMQLTDITGKIASLDLSDNEINKKLEKRADEAGSIARSMSLLRSKFQSIVRQISDVSDSLTRSTKEIQKSSSNMVDQSNDNSATTEELAASMEETSAATDDIDNNISHIQERTSQIYKLTEDGNKMASDIMTRAESLKNSSQMSINKANDMYLSVKTQTEQAIEKAKSVDKIQSLADSIRDIASQTSLLSLNASIEAARAGEQGRGFAVVAGEIGSLASQSTETVNNITEIVTEVQNAVSNMSECLTQTLKYLDSTVSADYKNFAEVGRQYNTDAGLFDNSMSTINKATDELSKLINDIATAIEAINNTVSDAAVGISDISGKTADIVELTASTGRMIDDNLQDSVKLNSIVGQFKLD